MWCKYFEYCMLAWLSQTYSFDEIWISKSVYLIKYKVYTYYKYYRIKSTIVTCYIYKILETVKKSTNILKKNKNVCKFSEIIRNYFISSSVNV